MKSILLLTVLACVACNPSLKEETNITSNLVEAAPSMLSFLYDNDKIKKLTGDSIRIFIADEEEYDTTLLPVGDEFYEQYIKNNNLFERKRNTTDFAEGANVNHYYWGQIENSSDYTFLLISQREELDFAVNKLFLFVFGKDEKLMTITPVAELGYYPGANDSRYSTLRGNKILEHISVQESIIEQDESDEDNFKYLYEKDSTIIRYAFDSGKFNRVYIDSLTSTYWSE